MIVFSLVLLIGLWLVMKPARPSYLQKFCFWGRGKHRLNARVFWRIVGCSWPTSRTNAATRCTARCCVSAAIYDDSTTTTKQPCPVMMLVVAGLSWAHPAVATSASDHSIVQRWQRHPMTTPWPATSANDHSMSSGGHVSQWPLHVQWWPRLPMTTPCPATSANDHSISSSSHLSQWPLHVQWWPCQPVTTPSVPQWTCHHQRSLGANWQYRIYLLYKNLST